MGAWLASSNITGEVMSTVDLPLVASSGYYVRLSSVPLWLYGVKYSSHFYYGLDAMSNIYWRQIGLIGELLGEDNIDINISILPF